MGSARGKRHRPPHYNYSNSSIPEGNLLQFFLMQNEIMPEINLADMLVGCQLLGRARHEHLAVEKQVGTVGDAQGLMHVMVGDEHPDVFSFKLENDALDVLNGDGIDTCKRLVQKNEIGVDSQGAGNLGATTFAARELYTLAFAHMLQAELVE